MASKDAIEIITRLGGKKIRDTIRVRKIVGLSNGVKISFEPMDYVDAPNGVDITKNLRGGYNVKYWRVGSPRSEEQTYPLPLEEYRENSSPLEYNRIYQTKRYESEERTISRDNNVDWNSVIDSLNENTGGDFENYREVSQFRQNIIKDNASIASKAGSIT